MTGTIRHRPVCLVTGAAGTLGSAFCNRYADKYDIAAVWNRRRPTAATQDQHLFDPLDPERFLQVNEHPVFAVRADLRKDADIHRVVDKVVSRFGRIDIVLNIAVLSRWTSLLDGYNTVENISDVFRINVAAPLALTSLVARDVWSRDPHANHGTNRSVLNLSSTAGSHIYEGYGQGNYSATKAALNTLTRHLAIELRPLGVRVNALAPDSFPGNVSLSAVLEHMQTTLDGSMTGMVFELNAPRSQKAVST